MLRTHTLRPTRASPRLAGLKPARSQSPSRAGGSTPATSSTKPARKAGGKPQPEYEFGGPAGAAGVMLLLPLVIGFLYAGCGKHGCIRLPEDALDVLAAAPLAPLWDWTAAAVVAGWTALHFLLYVALPGPRVEGVVLADGSRLKYPMNGHLAFWLSLAGFWHGLPLLGCKQSWVYDAYLPLATAACALSVALSVWSHALSYLPNTPLAEGGQTGNPVYDFFIGRPLNPRIGSLDLKACCELRPGLVGWAVLNLGLAAKQHEQQGEVSWSMVAVVGGQLLYVWDALYNEQAILTTMDITTDGFGFMLAFGDLAWVPFTYSLQARILVDHDPRLPAPAVAAIAALGALGYVVFRGANSQKDAFRRDPSDPAVSHLQWMQTKRGTKLLVSGWWGAARKINYTGDWLMGLSWSLACGAASPVAYFYPVYFAVLLVHRALRDDHFCATKYGADWEAYKRRVPFVFVPGIL